MKKITVIGATGMIGKPVTIELLKAGYEVTALVRDAAKAAQSLPKGITLVQGDLHDKAAIMKAMAGAEGLYINISTQPTDLEGQFSPECQGLDNILECAKKVGTIEHLILLSSFLARNYVGDWWVMKAKKSGIERVKASGIPFTIFYPSNFMENFRGGMVQNGKLMVLKVRQAPKAWWIAGEDFGRQVAAAFGLAKARNREYPVQGPQAFGLQQAAEAYASHVGNGAIKVVVMPFWVMQLMGHFNARFGFLSKLMKVMLHNREVFESQSTWDDLGKPQITMADFARR